MYLLFLFNIKKNFVELTIVRLYGYRFNVTNVLHYDTHHTTHVYNTIAAKFKMKIYFINKDPQNMFNVMYTGFSTINSRAIIS